MAESDAFTAADSYIEDELTKRLKGVESATQSDVITCIHPIIPPFDDLIRQRVEAIDKKGQNLLVILETEGGSVETCERIVDVFRHHYAGEVSFLPNLAMSAGTILCMSGDHIFMDYYSILGPIDPQIQNSKGDWVPAVGYLEKFDEFVKESKRRNLTQAELAFFLDNFDAAQLHRFEQAREHGIDLLKQWLVKYKFKNWKKTLTQSLPVTNKMKTARAADIARKLNSTTMWRSHGRGISIGVIRNKLNLVIEDFGADPRHSALDQSVRSYYRLLQDYMKRKGWDWVVMTRQGKFAL